MNDIKWTGKMLYVKDVSIRMHTNPWTDKEEPYAVIHCGEEVVHEDTRSLYKKTHVEKRYTIMCFEEYLFRRIVPDREFSFSGKVKFGYGNTFLTATRVFDDLGFPVQDDESEFSELWNPESEIDDMTLEDSEIGEPEIAEEDE